MLDARGIPTPECPACGSWLINLTVNFDEEYNIASYFLDAECAVCHTMITAPTPIDHPDYQETL